MLRSILISLTCLLLSTAAHSADAPPVQLITSDPLAPTSTLEVRFSAEMVAADQLGKPAEPSPLILHPAVPGKFAWVSSRSGLFTPAEPYPLGTTIQVSLRPDLAPLKGEVLPADWKAFVNPPPFALKAWTALSSYSTDNASAEPRYALLFNADVNLADVAEHLAFTRAGGNETIRAKVELPDAKRRALNYFGTWLGQRDSTLTWAERFRTGDKTPPGVRGNQVFVQPEKPLPVGAGWRLIVPAGLPAREGDLHLLTTAEIPVGTVQPFVVSEVVASNSVEEGRRLVIEFNKAVADDLKPETIGRWISVTPPPAKVEVAVTGALVTFSGSFDRGTKYRVAIEPGLAAAEPFVLADGVIREVTFEPIPASVQLQAFDTHQMNAGRRLFHLRAVNVPRLQVTAKLFAGDTVPIALLRYEDYLETPESKPGVNLGDYTRLDVAKLPGKIIWQREIVGTDVVDEQKEVPLDWNQILGPNRSGVVLLSVEQAPEPGQTTPRPGAQAIVQLTDLGAVWKRSPNETFVHVFSMQSGKAIAGAKLRLLGEKDEPLGSAITDANGLARLPAPEGAQWLDVRSGADTHLIEFKDGEFSIDLARVDVEFDEEEERSSANTVRAFLFSERGVYKPGETVHLKGIVRDWSSGQSKIVPGAKGRLIITDPREREISTRNVTISASGSFAEDIKLPKGQLGTFSAVLRFGKADEDESPAGLLEFEVQEFKPNSFEIAVAAAPTPPGPAKLEVPVTAKYYMGKALSKAQLTWSIEAEDDAFEAEEFPDFDFGHAVEDERLNRELDKLSHFELQGKAELDAKGLATITATVPLNTKAPQPREVRVLCEITDVDQQTVSASKTFVQHSSDFYLGVRQFRSLVHVGEPLPLEVVAVRTDGTPNPEPVAAKLQLTRIDWETNRVETAGEASEYENEAHYELITRREIKTSPVVKQGRKWVASVIDEPLVAEKPGQYLLQLSTRDGAGREVVTTTTFEVYGEGLTAWDYRNPYQIELVPDKDDYVAGETAKILVKTPISGEAIVTVERDKVLRTFTLHLEGNAPAISVPLEVTDAPNVFVSVMLLRGAKDSPREYKVPEYRIGYCELAVARPDAKLAVYVKPEAKAYQPGQEVVLNVDVLDYQGKPVSGAEVALYAVDEGVLSLTGYTTPDPLEFFNEKRPLTVSTALTLPTLLEEDPEKHDFSNKGYLIGGGGDGDDGMRKNFLACAFWAATLSTDAHGKLSARFTAPDSLTRYRVIGVVQTKRDQFGSGESAFEINKPVMLQPSLPRFANVGDALSLRAVLHNTTDQDGEAEVALTLDATVKAAETTRKISLPAHATVSVDFPVEFIETGKAKWKWAAHFTGKSGVQFRDLVQSELNVGFPAPLLREVRTFRIEAAEANALEGVDPRILEGRGTVRVSLTNSRAIELQESLRQLLHYPYGCVEQTASSTFPWLTLGGFRDLLPSLKRTDEEIAEAINHGIERLLKMQTDTGGLAYWPGQSDPMLWGSAYASLVLTRARQQGYAVADEDYDALMKWMSEQLRGTASVPASELNPRCLALYALAVAGRAEPGYFEVLFNRRAELGEDDRTFVALAIIESKGNAAMLDELLKPAAKKFDDGWFGLPARTTALQLLAWSRHRPKTPRVEELARELFSERQGGHWWTTQGNAWALIAMGDYLKSSESANKAVNGRVAWGDQAQPFKLGSKAETTTRELAITPESANARFRIEKAKAGVLFSEVTVESYPKLGAQPAQDRGYALRRRYAKVEDDGTLSEAKDLRVGDRVLVTLDLEVRKAASYLAIDDPLPAILEAVNPAFKSQATRAGEKLGTDWMSDFRELREDRAMFFADRIVPGNYTLRYLARCSAAGTATAPSAKVEEMYHPERFGLTESMQVTSLPLQ